MARSDLLADLVRFGANGDVSRFRNVTEAIIAEERKKQHTVLADRLEVLLRRNGSNHNGVVKSVLPSRADDLLREIVPQKELDDLILPPDVDELCHEFISEHHRRELLNSYGLEPRNRILLIGPPGNGKTSLAEALANALMIPMFTVRYESVIGTYLGETSVRLRRLFEHVCTRRCMLFFDEFETLGKERGDTRDVGEIKRVVSSLLMQIDSLPNYVVVVGATNHPELLDRAAWRRFQLKAVLPKPSVEDIGKYMRNFISVMKNKHNVSFNGSISGLVKILHSTSTSYSDIEEFCAIVFRQYVLDLPNASINDVMMAALKKMKARADKINYWT